MKVWSWTTRLSCRFKWWFLPPELETQRSLKSAAAVDWKPAGFWTQQEGQRAGGRQVLWAWHRKNSLQLLWVHDFYTYYSFPITPWCEFKRNRNNFPIWCYKWDSWMEDISSENVAHVAFFPFFPQLSINSRTFGDTAGAVSSICTIR